ncbi:serine protease [Vibrio sp. SCSIO 43136]|uniref:S1 family peptidase n=1 Tax=Vibrio sp. SCSIO 43136 TaxID=2819101 RepID=UPI002074B5FA|nr:serine protease [Vibrio sp. SCSIO 43136]USD68276.1 serine protease [Vibrio sp. SCSIO 43136]
MKRRYMLASIAAGLMAGSVLASEDVAPMIINGTEANASDYPYFASLYYDLRGQGGYAHNYCGATVIDEYHVLTAAHCVLDKDYNEKTKIALQVQDENYPDAVETAWASEFYLHPFYVDGFNALWANDIAIIKLATPLKTPNIKATFGVDADRTNYSTGSAQLTILGHGDTWSGHYYNEDYSDSLESAQVSFLEMCTEQGAIETPSRSICVTGEVVGSKRKAPCTGDSGGPLVWQDTDNNVTKIIGVTSYGPSVCGWQGEQLAGVYTEIATYTDWIDGIVSGTSDQQPYYVVGSAGGDSSSGGGSLGWLALLGLFGLGFWRRN